MEEKLYYTNREMQAVSIARLISDGQIAVVGTGLPLIGASIAKKLLAPNCHLIVESGIMDCDPKEVPTSVADCRLMANGSVLWDQYRYFGFQTNSMRYSNIDLIAFIGGAQIDPYGNVNSTCIGDYEKPKTRFTGSGGANGIATFFNTVIMMQHEKRRFVEKVDYLTSPGWIDGPTGRKDKGLPPSKGPQAVVTDLGIMKFDDETKRMYVDQYFPGVTLEQIVENTGFDIDVSRAKEAEPPSVDMIEYIRTKVDPHKVFIKY